MATETKNKNVAKKTNEHYNLYQQQQYHKMPYRTTKDTKIKK